MKVILVSPYSENLVGGIINWTKYIVNYHRKHGGDVDMCLLNNEKAMQVLASTNLLTRLVFGLKTYFPIYRKFIEKTTVEHFDLVHICTSASYGLIRDLLIVRIARKRGMKIAVHMHFGRIPQLLHSRGWEKKLFLRLMRKIDLAIVMDKVSLEALETADFKNVCFLPNPLSSEVLESIEGQRTLEREPRKIVFAGHVVETKGVLELVEACRDIHDIKMELLGKVANDDIREKLMKVGGYNVERWLSIPGNVPFGEVIREMMTCAIFVLPSYSEGFPNVILESMACGCPIIATSVGAIPDMLNVDSEIPCGVCVPVKNVSLLRNAINDLLDNPNRATFLGGNARTRVNEMYAMPKVWEQLIELWRNMIENVKN